MKKFWTKAWVRGLLGGFLLVFLVEVADSALSAHRLKQEVQEVIALKLGYWEKFLLGAMRYVIIFQIGL